MKSKYLLIAMLFGVTLSTVACKKCVTCTINNNENEVCKSDYKGIPGAYNAQVKSYENLGYECN